MKIVTLGLALLLVVFVPGLVKAQPVVAGGGVGGVSPLLIQAIEQDILALQAAGFNDQQIFAYLLKSTATSASATAERATATEGWGTEATATGLRLSLPGLRPSWLRGLWLRQRLWRLRLRGLREWRWRGSGRRWYRAAEVVRGVFLPSNSGTSTATSSTTIPGIASTAPASGRRRLAETIARTPGSRQRHVRAAAGRGNHARVGRAHVAAHHAHRAMGHHRASVAHRGGHRGGGHAHRGGGHRGGGHAHRGGGHRGGRRR